MIAKTTEDFEALKTIGRIVAEIRDAMRAATKPGVTTKEIDDLGGRMLKKQARFQVLKGSTISLVSLVLV